MTCETTGCQGSREWWIYKLGRGVLVVCGACRDELTSLWGWTFGGVA